MRTVTQVRFRPVRAIVYGCVKYFVDVVVYVMVLLVCSTYDMVARVLSKVWLTLMIGRRIIVKVMVITNGVR